jgi:hypothetical protein
MVFMVRLFGGIDHGDSVAKFEEYGGAAGDSRRFRHCQAFAAYRGILSDVSLYL